MLNKTIIKTVIACVIMLFICTTIIMASGSDSKILTPTEDQYFELRAVEIKEIEGQNKQVIMELWGNNIEFKRIRCSLFI